MRRDPYPQGRDPLETETGARAGNGAGPGELARRLAETLPDTELRAVVGELSAQQARLRAERYASALSLARAALQHADLVAAREEAQRALGIDYVHWEAHQVLGEVFEHLGDRSSALSCYATALHLGWETDEAREAIRRVC